MIFIPFYSEFDSESDNEINEVNTDVEDTGSSIDDSNYDSSESDDLGEDSSISEGTEQSDTDRLDWSDDSVNDSPDISSSESVNEVDDVDDSSLSDTEISSSFEEQNDEDYTQSMDSDSGSDDSGYESIQSVSDNVLYPDFNYQSVSVLLLGTIVGCLVGLVCWKGLRS